MATPSRPDLLLALPENLLVDLFNRYVFNETHDAMRLLCLGSSVNSSLRLLLYSHFATHLSLAFATPAVEAPDYVDLAKRAKAFFARFQNPDASVDLNLSSAPLAFAKEFFRSPHAAQQRMLQGLKVSKTSDTVAIVETLSKGMNLGGASAAMAMTRLRVIDFSHSENFGSRGAVALCKGLSELPRGTTLDRLDLYGNGIGDVGAKAVGRLLPRVGVRKLRLGWNAISAVGVEALATGLNQFGKCTTLDLSENKLMTNGVVCLVTKWLEAGEGRSADLRNLNLSWNKIDDGGARALFHGLLRSGCSLEFLTINENVLTSACVPHFTAFLLGGGAVRLQSLGFAWNDLSNAGMAKIGTAMQQLAAGRGLSALKTFDVRSTAITDPDAIQQVVAGLLHATGVGGADACDDGDVERASGLTALLLDGNKLGDVGLGRLCQFLPRFANLKALSLGWTSCGDPSMQDLSRVLTCLRALEIFNANGNQIQAAGARALGAALPYLTHLRCVDLSSNSLGADGVSALAACVTMCQSLTSFDLSWNNCGDSGARDISEALGKRFTHGKNTTTSAAADLELTLSWNRIEHAGARAILNALAAGPTHLRLHLTGNDRMGADGEELLRRFPRVVFK